METLRVANLDSPNQNSWAGSYSIRKYFVYVLAIISLFILTACGGANDADEPPDATTITLSGSLSINILNIQSKLSYRIDPLDWSNALIEIIDLSGNVVATTTASGNGSFSVLVPPGPDYFIRASIGNLVLKAIAPASTTDQTIIVDPTSSAIVEVLGQIAGNANIGDAGTDVSALFPAGTLGSTAISYQNSPLIDVIADAILADINSHYDPGGTTPSVGSASTAGDNEAKTIANARSDSTPPITTASPVGGSFSAATSVTLTCDDGDGAGCYATSIHYTLDGSEPALSSAVYVDKIVINTDTTIKYFSVDIAGNRETFSSEVYKFNYTVGGSVSGLVGTLVLRNNGEDLTLLDNGDFVFTTAVADGGSYNVSILTPPDGLDCSVIKGNGKIAGANVIDVAISCAEKLGPTLSVVLQQRSSTGAIEGVSGVRVVYNKSGTGAFVTELVTNNNGEVNFGEIGDLSGTITIVAPDSLEDAKTIRRTATLTDVPVAKLILRFDRIFRPGQTAISTVNVTGDTSYLNVYSPTGMTDSWKTEGDVDIYPLDIQSNGKVSMVVAELGEALVACGALLDATIPANGNIWYIPTESSPLSLHYLGSEPVELQWTLAYRNGVMFNLVNESKSAMESWAHTCADRLVGSVYMHIADTRPVYEEVLDGYTMHRFNTKEIVRQSNVTLPGPEETINIDVADITFTDLNVSGPTVNSGIEGTAAGDVDAAVTRLEWDKGSVHYEWLIFSPVESANSSFHLPSLPGDLSDRLNVDNNYHILEQEQVSLNNVNDYAGAVKHLIDANGDLDFMFMKSSPVFSAFRSVESYIPTVGLNLSHVSWDSYDFGKVISNPGNLDCGGACSAGFLPMGTTIRLTAQPNSGARFFGWGLVGDCAQFGTDNPIDILLDESKNCEAAFGPEPGQGPYLLTASKGALDGLITSSPEGINYDGVTVFDSFASFGSGTAVELCVSSATVTSVVWSGGCSGTTQCVSVEMDADKSCHVEAVLPQ